MYSEDGLIMLSALQHFLFCPRQCALIHIEQIWEENRFTAEGRILHERVHTASRESRRRIRIEYDLPIRSLELGLIGRADMVEFHHREDGIWQPYPVEYKRGKPKKEDCDRAQLCAQALCLEEMLGLEISRGALYYGKKKRRLEVVFDHTLRLATRQAASNLHRLLAAGRTPPPRLNPNCQHCSFVHLCLPNKAGKKNSVARYIQRMIADHA